MIQTTDPGFFEIVTNLQQCGFVEDFIFLNGQLFWIRLQMFVSFYEFNVLKMYFVPDNTKGHHDSMIYGIKVPGGDIKGTLILTDLNDIISFFDMRHQRCRQEHSNCSVV